MRGVSDSRLSLRLLAVGGVPTSPAAGLYLATDTTEPAHRPTSSGPRRLGPPEGVLVRPAEPGDRSRDGLAYLRDLPVVPASRVAVRLTPPAEGFTASSASVSLAAVAAAVSVVPESAFQFFTAQWA